MRKFFHNNKGMGCVSSKQQVTPSRQEEKHVDEVEVTSVTQGEPSISFVPHSKKGVEDDSYMIDYVLKEWTHADRDNSGRLSLQEIMKLLHSLNISMKESAVKERMKRADKDASGELDFNEFRHFLEELRTRQELKGLFSEYSKGKPYMTEEDFFLFLQQEQYELDADKSTAAKLIREAQHSESATKLFYVGFSEYIISKGNSAYNAAHRAQVYQPMDQPLSHYFIASSHNTYLEGHQLKGISSVDAYAAVLKSGCRCVELDCWDGDDGYPIIYHGHTMVTKIKFRDVIQTIKDTGFVTSPYPVILSFENHCSIDQQVKMAQILVEILGDMLPKPFILEQTRPLPSPEQLKYKVLIRGKMVPASQAETSSDDSDDEEEDDDDSPSSKKAREELKKAPKPAKVTTAKELSDLVHLKSAHYTTCQAAKDKNAPWETSSFSELKVKKLVKSGAAGLVEYNMNQVNKTYPKGTRFDSSNYMPMPSWVLGFHVIALNYQTADVPMRLNMGKFWDNGGCGMVLKPQPMRVPNCKPENVQKMLHVRLVSGWQLPKESGTPKGEVIDPYVKIKVFGVPEDSKKFKSKVIQNNGFNPVWDEKVSFAISRSDLAEILFEIYDQDKLSKDDFIGYCAIPIASLKSGYRSVQLYDTKNQLIPDASLLVQFAFE